MTDDGLKRQRPSPGENLLLVGASVRAAAFSAVRAGFQPIGIDLFGDVDLRDVADVQVASGFPRGLSAMAERVESCRWLYTGGLENHPQTVAAISRRHRLLGNPPDILRAVRNPFRVADALRAAALPPLAVRKSDDPPPADGCWMLKPWDSGGGRGIRIWDDSATNFSTLRESHYFQERFTGTPISAVFVASRLSCRLVGVTRQLIGELALSAVPFAYCGSLGPLKLPASVARQIEKTGRVAAEEFQLRGLFGIDFLAGKSSARMTEINPRYTASVEVLELSFGLPLLAAHAIACESYDDPTTAVARESELSAMHSTSVTGRPMVGKAILFADRPFAASAIRYRSPQRAGEIAAPVVADDELVLADIPQPGTAFQPGDPVCSVFAAGKSMTACLNRLFQNAYSVHERIAIKAPSECDIKS